MMTSKERLQIELQLFLPEPGGCGDICIGRQKSRMGVATLACFPTSPIGEVPERWPLRSPASSKRCSRRTTIRSRANPNEKPTESTSRRPRRKTSQRFPKEPFTREQSTIKIGMSKYEQVKVRATLSHSRSTTT